MPTDVLKRLVGGRYWTMAAYTPVGAAKRLCSAHDPPKA
jgi:hypothetical protein